MVVAITATSLDLANLGSSFKWPEHVCEKCSRKMWGHGFVDRYFESILHSIRIKRLICPSCGMVVVFRPSEYWPRFRSSILAIYVALIVRLRSGFWPVGFKRQRGRHWLSRLMTSILMAGAVNPVEFLRQRQRKRVHFFV
jgi:hypothetical protein